MNISSIKDSISSLGISSNNNLDVKNQGQGSFSNMLKDAIGEVNQAQVEGYNAMEGIVTGKVANLQEAVQRIEEAELSLKLALEVKNKAIAAYKEVARIQA
ncbi:flagellar hook-basal body complex protein FliE [Malaciobacter mytili]|uniref:flagellar hook-basal body complex protein FliE n=1 Tax=Malaciobacter mytili TaxID=603050 RepID=UPI003A8A04DC